MVQWIVLTTLFALRCVQTMRLSHHHNTSHFGLEPDSPSMNESASSSLAMKALSRKKACIGTSSNGEHKDGKCVHETGCSYRFELTTPNMLDGCGPIEAMRCCDVLALSEAPPRPEACPRRRPRDTIENDRSTFSHSMLLAGWSDMAFIMREYMLDISLPKMSSDWPPKVIPAEKPMFIGNEDEIKEQVRGAIDAMCHVCDSDEFTSNSQVWECLVGMRAKFNKYVDTREGMTATQAAVVLLTFGLTNAALVASALFPPLAGLGVGAAVGFKAGMLGASAASTFLVDVAVGGEKVTLQLVLRKGTLLVVGIAGAGLGQIKLLDPLAGSLESAGAFFAQSSVRYIGFDKWLAAKLNDSGVEEEVRPGFVRPLGTIMGLLKRRELQVLGVQLTLLPHGRDLLEDNDEENALTFTKMLFRNMAQVFDPSFNGLRHVLVPRLRVGLVHQFQGGFPIPETGEGYDQLVKDGLMHDLPLDEGNFSDLPRFKLEPGDAPITLDSPDPAVFGGAIWLVFRMEWQDRLAAAISPCIGSELPEVLRYRPSVDAVHVFFLGSAEYYQADRRERKINETSAGQGVDMNLFAPSTWENDCKSWQPKAEEFPTICTYNAPSEVKMHRPLYEGGGGTLCFGSPLTGSSLGKQVGEVSITLRYADTST